tara:strand:- start:149 stop:373 length:225 start_codon:yes stop_codon:yes gene_type:complete
LYLDQNSPLFSIREEVIREEFLRRMDIKKELDAVQKKINEIKKSQETLKKIADLQEKQDKKMAKRPYSGGYEMM